MFANIGNLSHLAMGQVDVDGRYTHCLSYIYYGGIQCVQYSVVVSLYSVFVFGVIRQAGQGLTDLLKTPQVEHFLFGTPMSELAEKQIYKHGALRKVSCTYHLS